MALTLRASHIAGGEKQFDARTAPGVFARLLVSAGGKDDFIVLDSRRECVTSPAAGQMRHRPENASAVKRIEKTTTERPAAGIGSRIIGHGAVYQVTAGDGAF